jgi:hypothetical protein
MSDEQTDDRVDAKEAAAAAFVAALGELTNPGKDSKATVQTKTGGSYAYEYAGLDSILDGVRPVLARHGLALSQPFGVDPNGLVTVRTRVLHERGVAIEGDPISRVVEGGPQEVGSFVTYARRYEVVSLLGIHPAGEDDDAAAAQPAPRQRKPKADREPPAEPSLPDPLVGGLHLSERTDDALRDLVKAPPSAKLGQYAQGWLDKRAAEAAEQAPPLPEMGQPEFEAPSGSGE